MKKDEKFCKILFGAVLLEVGVLGAVGLAIAAAVLRQGSTSGLLRVMENTGVFYPALLLFWPAVRAFTSAGSR